MAKRKLHHIFGDGPLSQPLPRRVRIGPFNEPLPDPEYDRRLKENIQLLFAHYGAEKIRPGQERWKFWAVLFRKLASDLVPGLREADERPKRGRPPRSRGAPGVSARIDLLKIAREIMRARTTADAQPKWTNIELARRIKRRLDKQADPHFFKGRAVGTIRHHLALALREMTARKQAQELAEALERYSPPRSPWLGGPPSATVGVPPLPGLPGLFRLGEAALNTNSESEALAGNSGTNSEPEK